MKGKTISVYLNRKHLNIVKEALEHDEAEEYELLKTPDVLLFGLKLVKKYFQLKDPVLEAEIRRLLEWI